MIIINLKNALPYVQKNNEIRHTCSQSVGNWHILNTQVKNTKVILPSRKAWNNSVCKCPFNKPILENLAVNNGFLCKHLKYEYCKTL